MYIFYLSLIEVNVLILIQVNIYFLLSLIEVNVVILVQVNVYFLFIINLVLILKKYTLACINDKEINEKYT